MTKIACVTASHKRFKSTGMKYLLLLLALWTSLLTIHAQAAEYILVMENEAGIYNVAKFTDDGLYVEDKKSATIRHFIPKNAVKGLLCIDRTECAQNIEKNKERADHILKLLTDQELIEKAKATLAFLHEAEVNTAKGLTFYLNLWREPNELAAIKRDEAAQRNEQETNEILRKSYYQIDNSWIKLPEMDLSKPSSQTKPFREFHLDLKRSMDENKRQKREWEKEKEAYEQSIDSYAIGKFGKEFGGARWPRVIQILDSDDMIVEVRYWKNGAVVIDQLWLHGFNTAGLAEDAIIQLGKIAIIGTKTYITMFNVLNTLLLAVPMEQLQRGLSNKELALLRHHLKGQASSNDTPFTMGTLHDKKISDWHKASLNNKIATCEDYISKMESMGAFKAFISNQAQSRTALRGLAVELVQFIDTGTQNNLEVLGHEDVSAIAIMGMQMMKWMK